MKSTTIYLQGIMALLAAVLLTTPPTTGSAVTPTFTIIPPNSAAAQTGMTYGEWSAVWWQYVLSKTASDPNNPLLDQTGDGCAVDQPRSSPVFFLAGVSGSGTVTRDKCIVPAGKALFFPLVNAFDVHVPDDGLDTPELVRLDLLKSFNPITDITELHASIDGVPVGNLAPQTTPFRACAGGDPVCSSAFSLTLPGNNLIIGPPPKRLGRGGEPLLRAGIYAPAVADGFYLMLAPLLPGSHTINFGGTGFFAGNPLSQEITYNLFVK